MSGVDTVQVFYDAVPRGDLPAALGVLADDVRWTESDGFPYAGTYVGPDAVRDGVFARLGSEWDPFVLDVEELIDGGDTVVAIGTYSGTYRATGKSMRARVAHVWKLRDGKAVSFEQFVDTAAVAAALA